MKASAVMAAIAEDFDTCIGEVLRNLDQLHIADNTLVILHLRQWRCTEVINGGKGDLGEGGIREPLIVRGPGIKGGTRSDTPVVSYDIMATVLDFVKPGFVLAQGVEGGSWKPLLLSGGKEPVKRPSIASCGIRPSKSCIRSRRFAKATTSCSASATRKKACSMI